MTVKDLMASDMFEVIHESKDMNNEILNVFCCDMHSIAMSKMPKCAAWVTIMGNVNTLAVATLTEASCIILAEGVQLDKAAKDKLKTEDIVVLRSIKPIFETALEVYKGIN